MSRVTITYLTPPIPIRVYRRWWQLWKPKSWIVEIPGEMKTASANIEGTSEVSFGVDDFYQLLTIRMEEARS